MKKVSRNSKIDTDIRRYLTHVERDLGIDVRIYFFHMRRTGGISLKMEKLRHCPCSCCHHKKHL
jgi:predicted  nucleic acid-binding Zn ribbon protein